MVIKLESFINSEEYVSDQRDFVRDVVRTYKLEGFVELSALNVTEFLQFSVMPRLEFRRASGPLFDIMEQMLHKVTH